MTVREGTGRWRHDTRAGATWPVHMRDPVH